MSKAEIEKFIALLDAWDRLNDERSRNDLLNFLAIYRPSLVNALRFYAADK